MLIRKQSDGNAKVKETKINKDTLERQNTVARRTA